MKIEHITKVIELNKVKEATEQLLTKTKEYCQDEFSSSVQWIQVVDTGTTVKRPDFRCFPHQVSPEAWQQIQAIIIQELEQKVARIDAEIEAL